jgi:hypothetical protein
MAPVFQAAGVLQTSSGQTQTVAWPTHLTNDIGLFILETSGNSSTLTPPTGWTAVPGSPVVDVNTIDGSSLQVWWKRATSSSEASIATGAPGDHLSARIYTFRGCVTTGNPWNVVTTGTKTTASLTATVPSLTTTVSDTLITMIVGRPNDSSSTAHFGVPINVNLTSLQEIAEVGTTLGNGGGFVVSSGIKSTAGSTGTSTLTKIASTTDTYLVLALKGETPELITTVGAFALNGTTSGLLKSNVLNNTLGTFTFAGNNLILNSTVALDVTTGSFTFAGNSVSLNSTVVLNVTAGSFVLNGITSELLKSSVLNSTLNTFTFTGNDLILNLTVALNVAVGSFALTGISSILGKQSVLNNTTGTFLLAGINLSSAFTYAIIGNTGPFLIEFKPADVAKNFQLVSSTGTYTLTGISSDAVKNYPIVALPQSYVVGTTDLNYFSTRRLETVTAGFVTILQSNGDFFWYRTTQTIPVIKPLLTNRNQWILGRATHMGRRGL